VPTDGALNVTCILNNVNVSLLFPALSLQVLHSVPENTCDICKRSEGMLESCKADVGQQGLSQAKVSAGQFNLLVFVLTFMLSHFNPSHIYIYT
jgi:hypothetical protein